MDKSSRWVNQDTTGKIVQLIENHEARKENLDKATTHLRDFVFDLMRDNGMWDSMDGVSEVVNYLPNCFLRFQLLGRYQELKRMGDDSKISEKESMKMDEAARCEIDEGLITIQKSKTAVQEAEDSLKRFIYKFLEDNHLWSNRKALEDIGCLLPECDLRTELTYKYYKLVRMEDEPKDAPAMDKPGIGRLSGNDSAVSGRKKFMNDDSLNELMALIEQSGAVGDAVLTYHCVEGLINYAAECLKKGGDGRSKIQEIHDFIDTFVGYWNIETEDRNADWDTRFADCMKEAELTNKMFATPFEQKVYTISGLFRYAAEMVRWQGIDAKEQIQQTKDLIQELTRFWRFDIPIVNQMIAVIDRELSQMIGAELSHSDIGDMRLY